MSIFHRGRLHIQGNTLHGRFESILQGSRLQDGSKRTPQDSMSLGNRGGLAHKIDSTYSKEYMFTAEGTQVLHVFHGLSKVLLEQGATCSHLELRNVTAPSYSITQLAT